MLNVGSVAEPDTLDPQRTDDDSQYPVLWRVYEGLVDFDKDGRLIPLLAAELPRRIDDRTWEVKLQPGVRFSDGKPFDADAAAFSINRVISREFGSELTEQATIARADKVDDETIRITTKSPDPLLPERLRVIKMVEPSNRDITNTPIGTGPYQLDEYNAASGATLVSNPEYRGRRPLLETVNVRFIPDPGTRLQALQAGEVDLIIDLPPDQAEVAPQAITTPEGTSTGLLRLNTMEGVFADPRVRQAVTKAIDLGQIVPALFGDAATPANCNPAPPQAANTDPSLQTPAFDVEAARALIDEAGATGKTVDMSWPSGVYPQDKALGEAIAQQIEAIGLKANLKVQAYNPWLKDIYTKGAKAPDMTYTETDNSINNVDRQVGTFFSSDGAVATYSDPEMDAQIKRAQRTLDDAQRRDLYHEILRKACDEAIVADLFYRKDTYGAAADLVYPAHADRSTKVYYDEMGFKP